MDPDAPLARKQVFLVDAEAIALVIDDSNVGLKELAMSSHTPVVPLFKSGTLGKIETFGKKVTPATYERPSPSDMAMLIYTSGTTGTPKGIIYDHTHLTHGTWTFSEGCKVDETSVMLLKSPYFWAVIEYEMFPPLIRGASLVVASPQGHKKPDYLVQQIAKEHVTVLMVIPSVLDLLVDFHESQNSTPLESLKHVVCVGEPLDCSIANRFVEARGIKAHLHNYYGASESSCTVYTVPSNGINLQLFPNKAPAGQPQPHTKVWVMSVDEDSGLTQTSLIPAKTGEIGEICFGGVLAAGYFKLPDLTKQKFVEHEVFGRIYRTGDLGRWVQGNLVVTGRMDRQVKVSGVRIEPGEIEAVLKRFEPPSSQSPHGATSSGGIFRHVFVVATPEPAQLVALVSLREGVQGITSDMLSEHCKKSLIPAYVPRHYFILEDFPLLPNGKPDANRLKQTAVKKAKEAHETAMSSETSGTVVVDSLGQMRQVSRQSLLEMQVIYRCYAFWMLGVMCDHWNYCAMVGPTPSSLHLYPFCAALANTSVPPWVELLIRGIGNDQDLFGFLLLGAFQDSRPDRDGKKSIKYGHIDILLLMVYLFLCFLDWFVYRGMDPAHPGEADPNTIGIHGLVYSIFGYPHTALEEEVPLFSPDFTTTFSWLSPFGHSWYIFMVLLVRLQLFLGESLRLPGWLQSVLGLITPMALLLKQILGYGATKFWGWFLWYVSFYIFSYHYVRPVYDFLKKILPSSPTWAALAGCTSLTLGMAMAMFHYPNYALETGLVSVWIPIEIGNNILQPSLLALAMAWLPCNMEWWGGTTLGCYCFHIYFSAPMSKIIQFIARNLWFDMTGMMLLVSVIAILMTYYSVFGPVGQQLLLAPMTLTRKIGSFHLMHAFRKPSSEN
eukprot:gnl/MRDRNA2_/MRDRNA2_79716_c0_seq1.p1 gnl/MRDRNA2_/MRDRNA2_79716_c0~~gnl/MRDRNA2_/MRDRNA2_79716_c0_seq1.p1  ORF type:complete len:991 (+),score=126.14 gnl/MRDRNA2_/MRDRNA2_79716_c0_seq1:303-2975(+)